MSAGQPLADPLAEAVAHVAAGGLLAYPTETLFGLGVDARNPEAVAGLRRWKGGDQPLSLLVDGPDRLAALGCELSEPIRALLARFWPGPLTVVLRCRERFAPGVARADGALGLRCSPHPLALRLAARLAEAGIGPITATSLNRHGEPPARTLEEARAIVGTAPDGPRLLAVPGLDAGGGPPSTVIDFSGPHPRLLREGAIERAELAPWIDPEDRA